MWQRIDDYYRIRNALNNMTEGESHCGLCYKVCCKHSVERVSYEDARLELTTWGEVALQEYPGDFIRVGEVAVYPSWPIPQEFDERFDYYPYLAFPKIRGGTFGGIVSENGESKGFNPDLTENELLTEIGTRVSRFGSGMYWGYAWRNEFYIMRLFRDEWISIRRKTLPSKNVIGLTIPDFKDLDFKIDGYHFLPMQTKKNVDFQTKYFEL